MDLWIVMDHGHVCLNVLDYIFLRVRSHVSHGRFLHCTNMVDM